MYQKINQRYCFGTFGTFCENFKKTKRYQNVPKNYSKVLFGHFWHFWQKFKKKTKKSQNVPKHYSKVLFWHFWRKFQKN